MGTIEKLESFLNPICAIEDMSDIELFYDMIGYLSFFETASEKDRSKCGIFIKAFMNRMGYTEEQLEVCRDKRLEGKLK